MTLDCEKDDFLIKEGTWKGYKLYDLYKEASTPYEWHKALFEYAERLGITIFSTPFDETAVDLLEELNTPAYKVASFEMTDLPLIKKIASTKKPMIILGESFQKLKSADYLFSSLLGSSIGSVVGFNSIPAGVIVCGMATN